MTGIVLLFLLLIIVGGLFVANEFIDGTNIKIKGNVSNNAVGGWAVSFENYYLSDAQIFDMTLWYFPWETKDILVEVEMYNKDTAEMFTGKEWLGSGNVIYSNKQFIVNLHYLSKGQYDGEITVYEVDKGFWGVFEKERELKARTTFGLGIV